MNAMTIMNLIQTKQASSPNRIWKDIGWIMTIITVLLIIGNIVEPTHNHADYSAFTSVMLIMAVIEIGGRTFSEYKQPKQAMTWLTLPATTEEKWFSQFLSSFILVPLVVIIVLSATTVLASVLISLFGWGNPLVIFNPISLEGWVMLKSYWIIHPLLFFGAIYFSKRPALKTFGFLALLILLLMLYIGFIGGWLFTDTFAYLDDVNINPEDYTDEEFFTLIGGTLHSATQGFEVTFLGTLKKIGNVLGVLYFPFFWGLSYLRFKELEL